VESSGTIVKDHSRVILPQNPTDVSSVCGVSGGGYHTYAVHYADFGGAVPTSAYRCQPRCNTNDYSPIMTDTSVVYSGFTFGNVTVPEVTRTFVIDGPDPSQDIYPKENLCSTIWDDYRPVLSVPREFSSMSPSKGGCEFSFVSDAIFYDPPIALTGKASIVQPTMPGTTLADSTSTSQATPTPDPGSIFKPTTPSATQLPTVQTDPPVVFDPASQRPDPGTKAYDVPSEPAQSLAPGTDNPTIPADPSQPPNSGTDDPRPSNNPSQLSSHGTGILTNSEPSTTGRSPTTPGSTHDSHIGAAPIGVVITGTDGQQVTALQTQPAGPVVVGSVTLTQGQSADIDGVGRVVVDTSGLSVDTTYHTFTTIDPTDSGAVAIKGTTLAIGALIVAGLGNFAASKEEATADDTSRAFTLDSASTNSAHVVEGDTFTAHATSAVLPDPNVTLVPGDSAVSSASHVDSMAPSGTYIVVDGTTQQATPVKTAAPVLSIDGTVYTANDASDFVVDGVTLTRGGAIIAGDTTVSLDASGQHVVVDGVTQSAAAPATPTTTDHNAEESATGSSISESATGSSASESATGSNSASTSNGGAAQASSARSIAKGWSWVNALVTMLGVCLLL
jgi:hypothetical protein